MMLARRKSGREFTRRHRTSYKAGFSFVDVRSPPLGEKFAAIYNTSAEPESPPKTLPQPVEETSVDPDMDGAL